MHLQLRSFYSKFHDLQLQSLKKFIAFFEAGAYTAILLAGLQDFFHQKTAIAKIVMKSIGSL